MLRLKKVTPPVDSIPAGRRSAPRDLAVSVGCTAPVRGPAISLFPCCPWLMMTMFCLRWQIACFPKMCLCWVFGALNMFPSLPDWCLDLCKGKPSFSTPPHPPPTSGPQRLRDVQAVGGWRLVFWGGGRGLSVFWVLNCRCHLKSRPCCFPPHFSNQDIQQTHKKPN